MGHSRASKADTHARIVAAAAARFKERGIDGISLADLMHELKLTHGGFYKHFASRDALVSEALEMALLDNEKEIRGRLVDADKSSIAKFIDFYLDPKRLEDRAAGCAVAALAGDAPRKSAAVQSQFRAHIEDNLRLLRGAMGASRSAADARGTALMILSSLYGALIMARAVGDSPLSAEILHTVRKRVQNLVPAPPKVRVRGRTNAG
jgi:TetR/AcrR family transcriptional repressor of nem operon